VRVTCGAGGRATSSRASACEARVGELIVSRSGGAATFGFMSNIYGTHVVYTMVYVVGLV
jgi:hypothetical protein